MSFCLSARVIGCLDFPMLSATMYQKRPKRIPTAQASSPYLCSRASSFDFGISKSVQW